MVLFRFLVSLGILRYLGPNATDRASGRAGALVWAWSLGHADPPHFLAMQPLQASLPRTQAAHGAPGLKTDTMGPTYPRSAQPRLSVDRASVAKRLSWGGVRRGRSELLLAGLVIRAGEPRLSLPSGPSPGGSLGLDCEPLRACAPQQWGRPLLLLMGSYAAAPGSPHPRFRVNSRRSGRAWPSALHWVAPSRRSRSRWPASLQGCRGKEWLSRRGPPGVRAPYRPAAQAGKLHPLWGSGPPTPDTYSPAPGFPVTVSSVHKHLE